MSIEWSEKYRIGDEVIDEEHKELFRIAKKFLEAANTESMCASAMELRKYTKEHFRREEILMHEVGYPLTATHLALHLDLISKLSEIEAKIERGELHQPELEEFINFWFIKHMAAVDAPLVVYVKRFKASVGTERT
jgi:hemerythrin-like metal-binding protein